MPNSQPRVSILVAARNEQENIGDCLGSLLALDYPIEKIEILIGDDQSTDNTLRLAKTIASQHNNIKVFQIKENLGSAKGKANVLAHLAREAGGEVLFITDADVQVPETWIQEMLSGLSKGIGIVNGFTIVKNNTWQNIDWLFALGMVKVIHDLGKPVTAMGNNMLITKKAYQAVGGYESLPFSITEDFELFKHVSQKGYETVQMANTRVMAYTRPKKSILGLLNQRKRWMTGAVQLPWPIVSLLSVQAFYYPSLILLFVLDPKLAGIVFGIKLLVQSFFILVLGQHFQIRVRFYQALFYEFYSAFLSLASSIFYILPLKIIWKGRKY